MLEKDYSDGRGRFRCRRRIDDIASSQNAAALLIGCGRNAQKRPDCVCVCCRHGKEKKEKTKCMASASVVIQPTPPLCQLREAEFYNLIIDSNNFWIRIKTGKVENNISQAASVVNLQNSAKKNKNKIRCFFYTFTNVSAVSMADNISRTHTRTNDNRQMSRLFFLFCFVNPLFESF